MELTAPNWLINKVREAKKGMSAQRIENTRNLLTRLHLSTVCEEAHCPNRSECFSNRTATFLILGDVCTRGCFFCAVTHGNPDKTPDEGEPERLAEAVNALGLDHVVITSVTRDDLPDGGAGHYASVVKVVREQCPNVKVDLLIPDFGGSKGALFSIIDVAPDVLAHNLETVPRLYPVVRRGADYLRSLTILLEAKAMMPDLITKSGIMLGLGEEGHEVESVIQDLREAGCDMLTIGQYLSPSLHHIPVVRYVEPGEFVDWQRLALNLGFKSVASGPLVRSSYKAAKFFQESL